MNPPIFLQGERHACVVPKMGEPAAWPGITKQGMLVSSSGRLCLLPRAACRAAVLARRRRRPWWPAGRARVLPAGRCRIGRSARGRPAGAQREGGAGRAGRRAVAGRPGRGDRDRWIDRAAGLQ